MFQRLDFREVTKLASLRYSTLSFNPPGPQTSGISRPGTSRRVKIERHFHRVTWTFWAPFATHEWCFLCVIMSFILLKCDLSFRVTHDRDPSETAFVFSDVKLCLRKSLGPGANKIPQTGWVLRWRSADCFWGCGVVLVLPSVVFWWLRAEPVVGTGVCCLFLCCLLVSLMKWKAFSI